MTMGILQPQLSYRWRLRVPSLGDEQHNRVATQTQSVKIDYKNRLLTVTLVQNATDTFLHEAIIKLVNQYTTVLHIDSLNGVDATPNYILEFDCKPVSHDFSFDYTERGTANHTLVFEYITMTPYNQREEQEEEKREVV